MSSAKHEKSFVDFEKPYEQNVIGLKGIIYFGVGLLLLIVITFALMWAFNGVLEENAQETKRSNNPMALSDREALPPEPRLQAAPGFGVDSQNGRVNLELMAPQSEYIELKRQWEAAWKNGVKDARTGTVVSLPIDQAKQMVLQRNLKARTGPEAEQAARGAQMVLNDSSSGRLATVRRR
jgi:hypothetical protein